MLNSKCAKCVSKVVTKVCDGVHTLDVNEELLLNCFNEVPEVDEVKEV